MEIDRFLTSIVVGATWSQALAEIWQRKGYFGGLEHGLK
jgi:hypothetical protein